MKLSKRIFNRIWLRKLLGMSFIVMLAVGCSDTSESPPEAKNWHNSSNVTVPYTIVLVMKTLTNPFFAEMEKGARRAEKDLGIELIVRTAAQETSIQQQISIVEELIVQNVDAIVIAPGDSVGLIPILKQAQDKGIVIVNIDNQLDKDYAKRAGLTEVPFIGIENEQAAYNATSLLVKQLKQPTPVVIIEGIRESINGSQRTAGIQRAIAETELTHVIASESANWKIDEAFELVAKLYNANPNIGAIICANDMMALGAIEYLKTTNKKGVWVTGFDAIPQALEAVNNGTLFVTVDQQAAEQGYQGVLAANELLLGNILQPSAYIEAKTITADNL